MSIVAVAVAYLVGSIPFSWLLVWLLKGVDLRTVGSGNPGATNAIRVVGKGWGGLAMALDVLKGTVAAAGVPVVMGLMETGWVPAACGAAAILGNVFCPFFWFKGGKAVATAGGVFLGLAPRATLVVVVLFFLVLAVTRKMSICSLTAAVVLPALITFEWRERWGDAPSVWVVGIAWLAAVIVVMRHRENIQRLFEGREKTVDESPVPEERVP